MKNVKQASEDASYFPECETAEQAYLVLKKISKLKFAWDAVNFKGASNALCSMWENDFLFDENELLKELIAQEMIQQTSYLWFHPVVDALMPDKVIYSMMIDEAEIRELVVGTHPEGIESPYASLKPLVREPKAIEFYLPVNMVMKFKEVTMEEVLNMPEYEKETGLVTINNPQ